MNLGKLWTEIEDAHNQLITVVERLTDADLLAPRGDGAWTRKDVLAHIADCYEEATARLHLVNSGRPDRIRWYGPSEIDAKNAQRQSRDAHLSPSTVRRKLRSTYDGLRRELARLTDEQANAGGERAVVTWLPGWSSQHVAEHGTDLDSSASEPRQGYSTE